jgi:hypothetical protein
MFCCAARWCAAQALLCKLLLHMLPHANGWLHDVLAVWHGMIFVEED